MAVAKVDVSELGKLIEQKIEEKTEDLQKRNEKLRVRTEELRERVEDLEQEATINRELAKAAWTRLKNARKQIGELQSRGFEEGAHLT